jgi:hypothetical protein
MSKLEFKKLNNIKIEPVVKKDFSKSKVKGKAYFAEPYANIALIARKKSGKSTLIYEIVKNCASTKTIVYIFASTVEKDDTYKELVKMLEKKQMTYYTFMSIKDGTDDMLKAIIDDLKQSHGENGVIKEMVDEGCDSDAEDEFGNRKKKLLPIMCSAEEVEKVKKEEKAEKRAKKKATKLYPKYMFIFDDLSTELKNKNVDFLLKTNRHYCSKVVVSTQWLSDLLPSSRRQMDYYILFKGLPTEKLEAVFKDADLHINYEEFLKLYEEATKEDYSFLYIDVKNASFRRRFDTEIIL